MRDDQIVPILIAIGPIAIGGFVYISTSNTVFIIIGFALILGIILAIAFSDN